PEGRVRNISTARRPQSSRFARPTNQRPIDGCATCRAASMDTPEAIPNCIASPNPQGTKRQRNKESKCKKRSPDPEAQAVAPALGGVPVAERGADVGWRFVPGTAAHDAVLAVAAPVFHPCRAIRRCLIIVAVGAILDPRKDVADHVMEAETV